MTDEDKEEDREGCRTWIKDNGNGMNYKNMALTWPSVETEKSSERVLWASQLRAVTI